MSTGGDWPTRYPWRLLPRGGTHPFVPPKGVDWPRKPKRAGQGYVDAAGNIWQPHRGQSGREEELHWDVQHPDGSHTNVRPDGEIHHGPDNFS